MATRSRRINRREFLLGLGGAAVVAGGVMGYLGTDTYLKNNELRLQELDRQLAEANEFRNELSGRVQQLEKQVAEVT